MDAEGLKSMGITTVGQRLAILKAVYQAKLAHNVPLGADHYIPPCARHCCNTMLNPDFSSSAEVQERSSVTVEKLHDLVREQGPSTSFSFHDALFTHFINNTAQKVNSLEEDNKRLSETVQQLVDEFAQARSSRGLVRCILYPIIDALISIRMIRPH